MFEKIWSSEIPFSPRLYVHRVWNIEKRQIVKYRSPPVWAARESHEYFLDAYTSVWKNAFRILPSVAKSARFYSFAYITVNFIDLVYLLQCIILKLPFWNVQAIKHTYLCIRKWYASYPPFVSRYRRALITEINCQVYTDIRLASYCELPACSWNTRIEPALLFILCFRIARAVYPRGYVTD